MEEDNKTSRVLIADITPKDIIITHIINKNYGKKKI